MQFKKSIGVYFQNLLKLTMTTLVMFYFIIITSFPTPCEKRRKVCKDIFKFDFLLFKEMFKSLSPRLIVYHVFIFVLSFR